MSDSLLIQYIRDPSSLAAKDLPRVLGEIECLRAQLWSALCAAAATTCGTTPTRSGDIAFLIVAEVAAKLKFSRGHVYELVRQGRFGWSALADPSAYPSTRCWSWTRPGCPR